MITNKYGLSGIDLKADFTNCSLMKRVAESLHTFATTAITQHQMEGADLPGWAAFWGVCHIYFAQISCLVDVS